MKADLTRDTFDPGKHFTRVLMQQGRVQLDADWNEQASIVLHYLRALAADLIGPHGGRGDSFLIGKQQDKNGNLIQYDFSIHKGHYYISGLLCDNGLVSDTTGLDFARQPWAVDLKPKKSGEAIDYLVYVDAWERLISFAEDDDIREKALQGPDTAARAQIVWQVKVLPLGAGDPKPDADTFLDEKRPRLGRATLRARAILDQAEDEPCAMSPDSRYRGPENQLYRVEIHTGSENGPATFKWSRDNGSVVFPIRSLQGNVVKLESLGRDQRLSLKSDDWVEIVDDSTALKEGAGVLAQVKQVDRMNMTVVLHNFGSSDELEYDEASATHPLLRRWDYQEGDTNRGGATLGEDNALLVREDDWITLEDGVQIKFDADPKTIADKRQPPATTGPGWYRAGDYWMIPARVATGDVEWPGPPGLPDALSPHGVEHYVAPLATIHFDTNGDPAITDARRKL